MANIRILYEDVSVKTSSIVASNTAAPTNITNVLNEFKGQAHRSTGLSVQYTLTWSSAQTIGCIALPATNLSGDATIRVRLYSEATLVYDSTTYACPGPSIDLWNWSMPLNVNSFSYGGVSKTAVWLQNQLACTSCIINLSDTAANTAGYIDCSRILTGAYWEPTYNVSNGISVSVLDNSSSSRNESGDLISSRSVLYDQLSFDFSVLVEPDRVALSNILRKVGTARNVLVSVFPDNNSTLEQAHTIYGKRSNSSINTELYGIYRHSMDLEGW